MAVSGPSINAIHCLDLVLAQDNSSNRITQPFLFLLCRPNFYFLLSGYPYSP